MEFRILGPIEVRGRSGLIRMRTGRTRSLLALLLVRAPQPVPVDEVIELLWVDPPGSAKSLVHNMVSGLRRATAAEDPNLVISQGSTYRIELGPHTLDLARFRQATAQGRRALARGEPALAAALLNEALGWWRGTGLAEAVEPLASTVRHWLDAERLSATELSLDAELATGHYQQVLDAATTLLAEDPYREDLYTRQMLALGGLGRRAEALAVYQNAYRRLVDDLGVEPGRELRELHQQLLDGENERPHQSGVRSNPVARPVPAQLPPAVRRLVGRDELLAQVRAALDSGGLGPAVVVLTGQGGVGKSALAVHAAHLLSPQFPDGQLYADLHGSQETPARPHEVLGRFLRALGVTGDDLPADPDERVGRFRSELAGHRLLLVLDDARDEAQLRTLLPGSASCGVVITSRRRLDALADAVTQVVPVLTPEAARLLLAEVSGHAGDGPDAEIADLCGYLPLALRIAGARLAARPDWTLTELHERLAGQRTRLDEFAVGDLDVRASITLSYRSLPDQQRVTLRRLGLLDATDLPAWVPAALAGEDNEPALDGLTSCHLVEFTGRDQAGQPRFRLHDLVHEFAREQTRLQDSPTARREALLRVLHGWLALATEAEQKLEMDSPPQPAARDGAHRSALLVARERAYDWFEAERANLLAAVHQAIALDEPELASDLVFRIGGFLLSRGYPAEREVVIRAVIDCWERLRTPDGRLLRHLGELFTTCGQQDDLEQMSALADHTMSLATQLKDQSAMVEALQRLAAVANRRGLLVEAMELDRRCVAESLRLGLPPRQLAVSRWGVGVGLAEVGHPAEAVAEFRQVLATGIFSGRIRAILLADFAEALVEKGGLEEAAAALAEAEEIVERIGDRIGGGRIRVYQTDLAVAAEDWPAARVRLEEALQILTTHGDASGQLFTLRRLGDVALGEGRADRATRLYERGLRLSRFRGAQAETARALVRLALAAELAGDHDRARRWRQQSQRTLHELRLPPSCLRLPEHLRSTLSAKIHSL